MTMGNLHIVTGYKGSAHVTAADTGSLNASLFGSGQKVLNRGNKFSASVISNNQIRLLDGDIIMQGRHIRLNEDTYVDLTIDNGASGMYRNDLIVARYTKNNSTGVEDCNLVVIKGTAASSNPSDPEYTSGNIIEDHDLQNDMPLYRVPLTGLNVGNLVCLFDTIEDNLNSIGLKQTATNELSASTDVADGDYFPYYDSSLSLNKKTLWSNIIAKIRTALFGSANGFLKADGSGIISATGSIQASDLANGAVTAEKIASGAVTPAGIGAAASSHNHSASNITSGTFGTSRIADSAVTTAKLNNGAVTRAKMDAYIKLTSGTDYGTSLPAAGNAGRIFFKKV